MRPGRGAGGVRPEAQRPVERAPGHRPFPLRDRAGAAAGAEGRGRDGPLGGEGRPRLHLDGQDRRAGDGREGRRAGHPDLRRQGGQPGHADAAACGCCPASCASRTGPTRCTCPSWPSSRSASSAPPSRADPAGPRRAPGAAYVHARAARTARHGRRSAARRRPRRVGKGAGRGQDPTDPGHAARILRAGRRRTDRRLGGPRSTTRSTSCGASRRSSTRCRVRRSWRCGGGSAASA